MKRNMDLIRLLLLDIEDHEEVDLSSYSEDEINYHKYLLLDGGFIEGNSIWFSQPDGGPGFEVTVKTLTWAGHDFIAAARDDSVWKRGMKKLGGMSSSVPFDVVKAVLTAVINEQLGI